MVVIVHISLQQSWPSNGTPTRQEAQLVLALVLSTEEPQFAFNSITGFNTSCH